MSKKNGRPIKNLSSQKFNHWEVLSFSYVNKKSGNAYWACMCDICETVYDVRSDSLQNGRSTKCKRCAMIERMYKYV